MTISIIQAQPFNIAWNGTLTSQVTPGNSLVLVTTRYGTSATLSAGSPTFHGSTVTGAQQVTVLQSPQPSPANTVFASIWLLPNLAGGSGAWALTPDGAVDNASGAVGTIVYEVAGLGTSPVLAALVAQQNGSGTSATSGATGPFSGQAILFGVNIDYGNAMSLVGAPWTEQQLSAKFFSAGYQIVNASNQSYTYGPATWSGSAGWVGMVAAIAPTPTGPSITTSSPLPNGDVGVTYSQTLAASNGTAPYTWAVTSGSLPAGLSLSSTGVISGTPTTVGTSTFTVQVTDAATLTASKSFSLTVVNPGWPDLTFSGPTTASGIDTWTVTNTINGTGGQTVRALRPTAPAAGYPHGILITLPAADGEDNTGAGDGFDTVQSLNAHNAYNLTVIESSYSTPNANGPIYADNTTNPNTLQETYTLELIRWAKATYGTTGQEKVYIIGFSKSALGAQTLIFRNSSLVNKAASWDFPADISDIEGDSQVQGAGVYSGLASTMSGGYGSDATFQGNYELTPAHLSAWAAADPTFTTHRRLWVGGFASFQAGITWYTGTALPGASILADTSWSESETHAWHSDWVAAALLSMLGPPTSGLLMVSGII